MNYTQKKKQDRRTLIEHAQERRAKRRYYRTDVNVGDVVEDCGLHIGHVVEVDRYSGDMQIKSLFTGDVRGCDLYHCGIIVQTTKEIKLKMEVWEKEGKDGLRKLWYKSLGMTKEQIEEALVSP